MERDPELDHLETLNDAAETSPLTAPTEDLEPGGLAEPRDPTGPWDPTGPRDPGKTPYQVREVIGRGGMGEVVLADDPSIGREVALKRMRGEPSAEAISRFLREAKIQARLDHPGIVPVYEFGRDDEGRPFFTMKRLTGKTLAAVLASSEATPQRLLRVMVDVCHAVELAHSRGVVHRDLKPSNIMLGDFGEVHVIDWGVARVLGSDEQPFPGGLQVSSTNHTRSGQILGTPGYMPPEQLHNEGVGPPADVYALGSILFEILAGEPLHPRGNAAIGTTLSGSVQLSPAARQPARRIAPELDAVCTAALAEDPEARPTARQLGDRIQRYLDGDRDLEARRVEAAELLAASRAAVAAGRRADAVRLCGRALVMDPTSVEAAALVTQLVLDTPAQLPDEIEAAIAESEAAARRTRSRQASRAYLLIILLTAFLPFMDVASWPQLILVYATAVLLSALSYLHWRTGKVPIAVQLTVNVIALAFLSRLAGPFMLTPTIICGVLLSVTALPWLNDRPLAVAGYAAAVVLLPFALEAVGLFARAWQPSPHGVISTGTVFTPGGRFGMISAFMANLVLVIIVGLFARAVSRVGRLAQRHLHSQTWHLQQLLPRRPGGPAA